MFCNRCGAMLPYNSDICQNCGSKLPELPPPYPDAPSAAPLGKAAADYGARRKRVIIIIVAAVLVCALGITAALLVFGRSPRRNIDDILAAADKYLISMNYEQAVIEFNKVIEIDPNNAYAYSGKAEALSALGRDDEALAALNEGYSITKDEKLADMIAEHIGSTPDADTGASVPVSVLPEPEQPQEASAVSPDESSAPQQEGLTFRYTNVSQFFSKYDKMSLNGNVLTVYNDYDYTANDYYYIDENLNCTLIDTGSYGKLYFKGNYGCTYLGANFTSSSSCVVKATPNGLQLIKRSDYPMVVSENGYIAYYAEVGSDHIVINVDSPDGQTISSTRIPEPFSTVYIGIGANVSRLKDDYPHNCFIYEKAGVRFGTDGFYIFGEDGSVEYMDASDVDLFYRFVTMGINPPNHNIYLSEYKRVINTNFPKDTTNGSKRYYFYQWDSNYYDMNAIISFYPEDAKLIMGMDSDELEDESVLRYAISAIGSGKAGRLYRSVMTYDGEIFTATFEDGKAGYIDANDNVLASGYEEAGVFCGDFSFVRENGSYYIINRSFDKLYEIPGTDLRALGNNVFSFVKNDHLFLIKPI